MADTQPAPPVFLMIGRMEGKLDALITRVDAMANQLEAAALRNDADHDALEARVAKLELWRAWMIGAAATSGALAAKVMDTLR